MSQTIKLAPSMLEVRPKPKNNMQKLFEVTASKFLHTKLLALQQPSCCKEFPCVAGKSFQQPNAGATKSRECNTYSEVPSRMLRRNRRVQQSHANINLYL